MCGIAGIYTLSKSYEELNPTIRRMTSKIAHRGPDGEGIFIADNIAIGHRRLSILDLSDNASQPFTDLTENFVISYNGEIYNYIEIRNELQKLGYQFRTTSDTEVLLNAYKEWGENCLNQFNGMFSFAIFDIKNEELFLARDRMGIKPLFYFYNEKNFVFASEIKSILEFPDIEKKLNQNAFIDYLYHNYTIAPNTLFQGINQLVPGHFLKINKNGERLIKKNEKYWSISTIKRRISFKNASEQFEQLLNDAVKIILRSDVEVGTFLSGGIDSSTICYFAKQHQPNIQSHSIIFDEKEFNEQSGIKLISNHLGINNFSYYIDKTNVENTITKLVYHAEELTADSSMLAYYELSKNARKKITVALSGDGADEILAGYETHSAYFLHKKAKPFNPAFKMMLPLARIFNNYERKVSFGLKLQRFIESLDFDSKKAFNHWRTIYNENELKNLLHGNLYDEYKPHDKQINFDENATELDRILMQDLEHYLANDMLVKADRMSMAHGLEVRVPFLDHRIVEFLFSLPDSYKLQLPFNRKKILKQVMRNKLPNKTIEQSKKGFNIPFGVWFKNELKEFTYDTISEQNLKNIDVLNYTNISDLLNKQMKSKQDHSHQIWGLLMFVLWWKEFMK